MQKKVPDEVLLVLFFICMLPEESLLLCTVGKEVSLGTFRGGFNIDLELPLPFAPLIQY